MEDVMIHGTFMEHAPNSDPVTLWWTNIAMEIAIFHGKIHYFYGHFQLQTVSSPEGNHQLPVV